MRDHNKLRAFELADELVLMIYSITKDFPTEEKFGLTLQVRRAILSVTSNIVEGSARESQVEYHRFLEIAFGSLKEAHYQFNLAVKLNYAESNEEIEKKFIETEKVLGSLLRKMRQTSP